MTERIPAITFLVIMLLTSAQTICAQGIERDEKAVATLRAMSDHLATLESFVMTGASLQDNRLDAGLIATVPNQVSLTVTRPGSLHMRQFDGQRTRDLYLYRGKLTLYDALEGYYANAKVPDSLEGGMDYALNVLGMDLPLIDMVFKDVFARLANSDDSVLYVTDNSLADGVDCHQLAIRMEDADVQLWVQQNGPPLPRRIIITSKWAGGAPRFIGRMNWDTKPDIPGGTFDFSPPEDATQIQFDSAN